MPRRMRIISPPQRSEQAMALNQSELVDHLKRQLAFLKNSVSTYDLGHGEEAVRIGVSLRVLFHDTNKSTSLLQLLGQKATIQVATSAKSFPSGLSIDEGDHLAGWTWGDTIHPAPLPPNLPTVSANNWWNEVIFTRSNVGYTRAQVALAAANKDGGAHVDEANAVLKALKESIWIKTTTTADGTTTQERVTNTHFRLLRRLADEVLNSPDLLALAT